MGISDFLLSFIILAGAGALLYRSVWKSKGGPCHGCNGCGVGGAERARASRCSLPVIR